VKRGACPLWTDSASKLCDAFLCGFGYGLGFLFSFRLGFGGELMLYLEGDGIGVHFVDLGCGAENLAAIILCSCGKQNDRFDNQLSECALLCLANECC